MDQRGLQVKRVELRALAAVACDINQYASLSGSALVQYIQDAGPNCANQMFASTSTQFAAFAKDKIIAVGNGTAGVARNYTGTDPNNGLEALYLWLRAGYYVAYYNPTSLPWRTASGTWDPAVLSATRGAIDALVNSGHFYDNSDANGSVIGEAITLMDSSDSQAYYLNVVKDWLNLWSQSYATSWSMRAGVNGIFTILFRGHQNADFKAAVANDTVLIDRLGAFSDKTWMLGTDAQFMIENSVSELARFLQYKTAPIYPRVQAKIKAILAQYTLLDPLYLRAAVNVSYYDDCNIYGTCGFEQRVEQQVLTHNYTCSPTIKMRAQALTTDQFIQSCTLLSAEEAYFHQKLSTNNQPVAGDNNTSLEVVVFDNSSDYQLYANIIFGIDTNNGGMYLEGDPSVAGNQARFICYRAEWVTTFEVWNLKHEYIHYLDGRFDMKGGFADYGTDTDKTVWWIEGLAEYVSRKDYNDASITAARTGQYTLSKVFANNYNSGQDLIYTWGYLATRFMFERHMSDVNTLLGYFRAGNYTTYLSWLNARLTSYDSEWNSWCSTVQSIPDGGDSIAPTVSITAPAAGATVSGTTTISATASDNVGVTKVELYVDGSLAATDTTSPYSASWNTTAVANGNHTLTAKAYDAASNAGTSTAVSVTVANGGGNALSNGVPVIVSGARNSQTVYYIDVPSGATNLVMAISGGTGDVDLYTKLGSAPTTASYDCRPYTSGNNETCTVAAPAAGRYYVMLLGYAAYSGVALKASFVAGGGDQTPPTASITAPTGGATVSGNVTISASASDNVGVTKVEFYVDGALLAADTSAPYGVTWGTGQFSNSSHSLTVKAYDTAGNVGTSAAVSVTVSNTATCVNAASGTALTNGTLHCVPASSSITYYYVFVPTGSTSVTVTTSGGTGDADLYVSPNSWATTSNYTQWSVNPGNSETITAAIPSGINYFYISVIGNPSHSGVTITATLR